MNAKTKETLEYTKNSLSTLCTAVLVGTVLPFLANTETTPSNAEGRQGTIDLGGGEHTVDRFTLPSLPSLQHRGKRGASGMTGGTSTERPHFPAFL